MIIDDFNISDSAVVITKTNTPLAVYSNAPLACTIPFQSLKPIARRNAEKIQRSRGIQLSQLAFGRSANGKPSARTAALKQFQSAEWQLNASKNKRL
jgi:hypothetical protein